MPGHLIWLLLLLILSQNIWESPILILGWISLAWGPLLGIPTSALNLFSRVIDLQLLRIFFALFLGILLNGWISQIGISICTYLSNGFDNSRLMLCGLSWWIYIYFGLTVMSKVSVINWSIEFQISAASAFCIGLGSVIVFVWWRPLPLLGTGWGFHGSLKFFLLYGP